MLCLGASKRGSEPRLRGVFSDYCVTIPSAGRGMPAKSRCSSGPAEEDTCGKLLPCAQLASACAPVQYAFVSDTEYTVLVPDSNEKEHPRRHGERYLTPCVEAPYACLKDIAHALRDSVQDSGGRKVDHERMSASRWDRMQDNGTSTGTSQMRCRLQ